MKKNCFHSILILVAILFVPAWTVFGSSKTVVLARQLTDTPGPDTTLNGIFITVITDEPQINVRMGPSSSIYPIVGILPRGATSAALGRSLGGDWIQIEYAGAPSNVGWVYSPLVQVSQGTLRIVEPPPTPVPPATSTIDPTLAAQFIIIPTNTRLSTFTPPPSLTAQIYTQIPSVQSQNSVPLATIIIAFAFLGIVGLLLSLIIRR